MQNWRYNTFGYLSFVSSLPGEYYKLATNAVAVGLTFSTERYTYAVLLQAISEMLIYCL